MIDIEADVFDAVRDAISQTLPNESFKSVYVPSPAKLPFATLMEVGNSTSARRNSTSDVEDFAIISFEAQVYAMDKYECKDVATAIDDAMMHLGFRRVSTTFVPNQVNPDVFRIVTRYNAEVSHNKMIHFR